MENIFNPNRAEGLQKRKIRKELSKMRQLRKMLLKGEHRINDNMVSHTLHIQLLQDRCLRDML